ncbi:MAG: metallophosphoesterase [Bacillales bacterium]|nr:metallophosphoesterase [Bacillales bacterium]
MKSKKIFLFLTLSLLCSSCSLQGTHHNVEEYMFDLSFKDNFKIMQLSDLHFSNYDDLEEDFKFFDILVNDANPDLIVITGDMFTFASKNTVKRVLNKFNSFNIPFTVAFGNHDEQVYADYEWMSKYIASLSNSLFHFYHDDLTGLSNNIINLKDDDGNVVYQLYVLDSNTYTYKHGTIGYDYIHQDQIDFYKEGVTYVNKLKNPSWTIGEDSTIPSFIYQHIPLPEFSEAGDQLRNDELPFSGINREDECPPIYNSHFYDTIKEYNSTKAIFVGHEHINNYLITNKDGIAFAYGAKSTDNMYHDDDMLGCRLTTIESQSSWKSEVLIHSYEEVK